MRLYIIVVSLDVVSEGLVIIQKPFSEENWVFLEEKCLSLNKKNTDENIIYRIIIK